MSNLKEKYEAENDNYKLGDSSLKRRLGEKGAEITPFVRRQTTVLDPKLIERQRTWTAPGKCDRQGTCCMRIPLPVSPRQLRESYLEFRARLSDPKATPLAMGKPIGGTNTHRDIDIIYPMLVGRCLGKKVMSGATMYIYGPCRNFSMNGEGLGECAIHETKPWMCSSYPNGGTGTFKGCGFKPDPEEGFSMMDFINLLSLDEVEK